MKKCMSIIICLLSTIIIVFSGCLNTYEKEENAIIKKTNLNHQTIISDGIEVADNKEQHIEQFVKLYFAYFNNKNYNKAKEFCTANYLKYFRDNSITESYREELIYITEIGYLSKGDWYYALVEVMSEPTVDNPSYGENISCIDYEYLLLLKEKSDGEFLIDERSRDLEIISN